METGSDKAEGMDAFAGCRRQAKHQGISASQDQKYADRDVDGYF